MADPIPDPLAAVEKALAGFLGGGRPNLNRAGRRSHDGSEPGSHKHPAGATKAYPSERAAKRRKRARSR